jgi:predicted dienelactone hydrolase
MSASGLREGPDTQIAPHTFASSRDATVAVRRFPLVIISRGGGGVPPLYRTIATHLAANGFVVVAPEHAGSTAALGHSIGGTAALAFAGGVSVSHP